MFAFFQKEFSLLKRNIFSRLGYPSKDMQGYHVVENILPQDVFEEIQQSMLEQRKDLFRQHSFFRKGAALDAHSLRNSSFSKIVDTLIEESFLATVQAKTNIADLQFVPEGDSNLISLLYYGHAGDGIDWHYDGNIYLGQRWAGILTFYENSQDDSSKLELEIAGVNKTFARDKVVNSLILFQGDQIKHRVRAMNDNEERLVINLLFTTNPVHSRNPLLRGYQSLVNYFFYGKLQSGLTQNDKEM